MKLLEIKRTRWKLQVLQFLLLCLVLLQNVALSKSDGGFCPAGCFCSKVSGIVNCSNISLRNVPGNLPVWTKALILENNRLTPLELSRYDFSLLKALEEINVDGNRLESLSFGIAAFRKISAGHCSLSSLPAMANRSSVATLRLSHNAISELDATEWSGLENLDVSFNKIKQIKKGDLAGLSKLKNLSLRKNRLAAISWDLFHGLDALESLDLSQNRIRTVSCVVEEPKSVSPSHCAGLSAVKHLNLSHNQLTQIPGLVLSAMRSLATLSLEHNRINLLQDGAFFGPESLETLILDHNYIGSVTKGWLYGLSELESLSLAFNNISTADDWAFCEHLARLNVSHNRLSQLTSRGFSNLRELESLDLSFNKIDVLEDYAFEGLGNLETLDLSENEISGRVEDVDGGFLGLDSIQTILLRNNRIRTLSASVLEGAENVATLDLRGNNVTLVRNHTFDKMQNLKSLTITSSSFLCDCRLSWFPRWLRENARAGFAHDVTGRCFHPESLKGHDIFNVAPSDFVCAGNPMPEFKQEPTSRTALKGDEVTFECRASAMVSGPVLPDEGLEIPENEIPKTEIPPADVTVNDGPTKPPTRRSGGFPLKADEGPGRKSRRSAEMPNYGVTVIWKHSGGIIGSGAEIRRASHRVGEFLRVTSRLVLQKVTSEDDGLYSCVVANDYGYAHSKPARLVVNQFPKFTKTPPNVTVVENGTSPVLECGATGHPPPLIQWQKDGGRDFPAAKERRLLRQQSISRASLAEEPEDSEGEGRDENIGMRLKPDRSADTEKNKFIVDTDAPLEFSSVLPRDSGEYECVVESSVGRIVAKVLLIVQVAPTFSEKLSTQTRAFVGSSVAIQCPRWEGEPSPDIKWRFEGLPLNGSGTFGDGRRFLVLSDLTRSDQGRYSCLVSNALGQIRHTVALEVVEDSKETIFSLLQSGDRMTWIVIASLVCLVLLAIPLSFLCFRKRRKEKQALSTNTDETDAEPPQLDTNSCSSEDSGRRGQNSRHNSTHNLGRHQESVPITGFSSPGRTQCESNYVTTPSNAFAKKAAGVDNYVPVRLKTKNFSEKNQTPTEDCKNHKKAPEKHRDRRKDSDAESSSLLRHNHMNGSEREDLLFC